MFGALASDVNKLAHELDTTEQRRLRLIGDVAHELRNPLSTIEGTRARAKDLTLTAELPAAFSIPGDRDRIAQVARFMSR